MSTGEGGKPRGKFIPPGYKSRLEAFMDVVRFGPTALPGAPFLALLFHVERSLPYGKEVDAASLSQMTGGIKRSDGSWVRAGSGLKKSTAAQANNDLETKGLLKRKTRESNRGGYQPTEYTVNWEKLKTFFSNVCNGSDTPLVHSADKGLSIQRTTPLVHSADKLVHPPDIQSKKIKSKNFIIKQSKEKQSPAPRSEIGKGTASAAEVQDENRKPFSLKVDDEKAKARTPFENPEMEFRSRI